MATRYFCDRCDAMIVGESTLVKFSPPGAAGRFETPATLFDRMQAGKPMDAERFELCQFCADAVLSDIRQFKRDGNA